MTQKLFNVQKVYAEDTNLKKEAVGKMFDWLQTQQHLPQLTEAQLVLFLHSCCYKVEEAQKIIDKYFTIRTNVHTFIAGDEDLIRRILDSFFIAFLPKRTPDNNAVLLVKLLDASPENYVCVDHTKTLFMIATLYFHQYGPANRFIVIFDMEGASLGHLLRMNISVLRQATHFLQEAFPCRIKGIHLINVNTITPYMINLVKPFMKRELFEMIKCHGRSSDSLYEFVPKHYLPKDFGGELSTVNQIRKENLENILDCMDFFKWHDEQKVDESKRETRKGKGIFGMFRK